MSKIKMKAYLASGESLFLGFIDRFLFVSSLGRRGLRGSLLGSLYKGTNSIMRIPLSGLKDPFKGSSPNTITLRISISTCEFFGGSMGIQ